MSIEANNIHAGYTEIDIVSDISIKADESLITCIIGPNGAGKSTLLKSLYGFLKPHKGKVLFRGEDITGIEPYELPKKGLGFILQRTHVFPLHSVRENLELGAWIYKGDKERVEKAISGIYERFPVLEEKQEQKAGELSGGQRRMLEMGRGLITSPSALMIDEPTAGLAPIISDQVYEKIVELKNQGITILMVDQNVKKAIEIADYLYVVKSGILASEGTGKEYETKMHDVIRDWLV